MDAVSGFLQQPFLGTLLLLTCGSAFLLLVSVIGIVSARTRRAQNPPEFKEKAKPKPPVDDYMHVPAVDSDLPDLDMLVSAPAPERVRRSGMFSVNLQEGGIVEAVEVMTILRDVVSGGLIVQIGDKAYEDMSRAPDFRNNFLKIMRELSPHVKGVPPAPTTAPPPPPVAEEPPEPVTPSEAPLPVAASEPDEPPEAEAPPVAADDLTSAPVAPVSEAAPPATSPKDKQPPTIELPGDLPRYKDNEYTSVHDSGGLFRRKKLEVKPIPELDIAGAIEAFIQHKLAQMPEYAQRSIHVLPAPDGGVSIEVDGRFYDAVGDVEDQAVREFLSVSIQEWQSRQ